MLDISSQLVYVRGCGVSRAVVAVAECVEENGVDIFSWRVKVREETRIGCLRGERWGYRPGVSLGDRDY